MKRVKENYQCANVAMKDQEAALDHLMIEKSRLDEQLKLKNQMLNKGDPKGDLEELHKMYESCEKDRNKLQMEVINETFINVDSIDI